MFVGVSALAYFCAFALLTALSACANSNTPIQRITAFSDIYGDYRAFESVLQQANLVDENGDWNAGETIVIQTSDIAGRGPDTRQIIAGLRELQQEAAAAGGADHCAGWQSRSHGDDQRLSPSASRGDRRVRRRCV